MEYIFDFNFEETLPRAIFGLTETKSQELIEKLYTATTDIVKNHELYSFPGTGEHEGDRGWHSGKIIKRLLEECTSKGEQFIVIIIYNELMKLIHVKFAKKQVSNSIKDFLKEMLEP